MIKQTQMILKFKQFKQRKFSVFDVFKSYFLLSGDDRFVLYLRFPMFLKLDHDFSTDLGSNPSLAAAPKRFWRCWRNMKLMKGLMSLCVPNISRVFYTQKSC